MSKIIDHNTTDDHETMADGGKAWLSASGNYFVRREWHTPAGRNIHLYPNGQPWNNIAYYNIDTRKRIDLAAAHCKLCDGLAYSRHCGDFRSCKCGAVSVDTDRWMPERHRYLGEPKNYNKIA